MCRDNVGRLQGVLSDEVSVLFKFWVGLRISGICGKRCVLESVSVFCGAMGVFEGFG